MGVSGHLHVLTACLLRWNTSYSLNRRLGLHQNQYGLFGQYKNMLLLLDVESCFLTECAIPSSAGSWTMILYWLYCPSLSKFLLEVESWLLTVCAVQASAEIRTMIYYWLCYPSFCWKFIHDSPLSVLFQLVLEGEWWSLTYSAFLAYAGSWTIVPY